MPDPLDPIPVTFARHELEHVLAVLDEHATEYGDDEPDGFDPERGRVLRQQLRETLDHP